MSGSSLTKDQTENSELPSIEDQSITENVEELPSFLHAKVTSTKPKNVWRVQLKPLDENAEKPVSKHDGKKAKSKKKYLLYRDSNVEQETKTSRYEKQITRSDLNVRQSTETSRCKKQTRSDLNVEQPTETSRCKKQTSSDFNEGQRTETSRYEKQTRSDLNVEQPTETSRYEKQITRSDLNVGQPTKTSKYKKQARSELNVEQQTNTSRYEKHITTKKEGVEQPAPLNNKKQTASKKVNECLRQLILSNISMTNSNIKQTLDKNKSNNENQQATNTLNDQIPSENGNSKTTATNLPYCLNAAAKNQTLASKEENMASHLVCTCPKRRVRKRDVKQNLQPSKKQGPPEFILVNSGKKYLLDRIEDIIIDYLRKLFKRGQLHFNPYTCSYFTPEAPVFNLKHMTFIILNILLDQEATFLGHEPGNFTVSFKESELSALDTQEKSYIIHEVLETKAPKKKDTFSTILIDHWPEILFGLIMGLMFSYLF